MARPRCALSMEGRAPEALEVLRESVAACRRIDADAILCEALTRLGLVHLQLGNTSRAAEVAVEALKISRKVGSVIAEACALRLLGRAHVACGELQMAEVELERARLLFRRASAGMGEGKSLMALGELYHARYERSQLAKDRHHALRLLEPAITTFRRLGAVPDLAAAEEMKQRLEAGKAGDFLLLDGKSPANIYMVGCCHGIRVGREQGRRKPSQAQRRFRGGRRFFLRSRRAATRR